MKRVWKPLDVAPGFRLYEVQVFFPNHPEWNYRRVIAGASPSQAAELYQRVNAETIWQEEPTITGHALNIYQPEVWWSDGNYFSGLTMDETEAIAKAAQEEVAYARSLLPEDARALKPDPCPTITPGVVWAVARAFCAMIGKRRED